MILRFGYANGPWAAIDDEMNEARMTPEHSEDYMRRLREQVTLAYQEMVAFDAALGKAEADDE